MAHLHYLDELIKEYLTFRGFTSTLRSMDNDLKNDKDKGFRADKITEQILTYIQTYDLQGLRELWNHLDRHIFAKLPMQQHSCVRKLESSILRFYVINTIQTHKSEKLLEFFEKMASELQVKPEWKEWYILPYLKNVEKIPTFAMYFSRQWQDTLIVSFQNFLSIVFQSISLPTLATYLDESNYVSRLQEENDSLQKKFSLLFSEEKSFTSDPKCRELSPPFLVDDFCTIAQETTTNDSQLKSLKSLLFGLGSAFPLSSSSQHSERNTGTPQQDPRRSSVKATSEEGRGKRSSSLNPQRRSNEHHAPVKRVSQGSAPRTPTKYASMDEQPPTSILDVSEGNKSPFIVLGQEYYADHHSLVQHCVFNPSGSLVASSDQDGIVKLWTPSPSPRAECSIVMRGPVTALEWLPKGDTHILLASKVGPIKLFNAQEKRTVFDINSDGCSQLKDKRIMCIKSSPSEGHFAVSVAPTKGKRNSQSHGRSLSNSPSQFSAIHWFDLTSQKFETSFSFENCICNSCAINHNGTLLFCGCNDGNVRILDIRSKEVVANWQAHQGEVFTLKLSMHQDKLYTMGSDNKFASWSLSQTGVKIFEEVLHERACGPFLVVPMDNKNGRSVLLRPYGNLFTLHKDDQHLFTCSSTGPIVYKIENNSISEVLRIGGHHSPIITLDWSSSLQCGSLAAASLDGKLSLTTTMMS